MEALIPTSNAVQAETSPSSSLPELRNWWAQACAEQAQALDGVPAAALMEHCLQRLANGHPAAHHELKFLQTLIGRWLHRLSLDIAAFPESAVPVLLAQKTQLQATRAALMQMQQALQRLGGEVLNSDLSPAAGRSLAQPASAWLRHRAPVLAWASRHRGAAHVPRD